MTSAATDGRRGRRGRRRLSLLSLVVVSMLLTGCGATGLTPVELSVLTADQEQWDGREVEVTGVVRTFEPPRHYWIEDADQHRVELVPHDGLAGLVDRRVTVRGRFTFREGEGRRIAVENLAVSS